MIRTYVNDTDITSSVEYGSLQLTDQLNNRRNTAKFRAFNTTISEAQVVEIFRWAKLTSSATSWTSSIVVDDTFQKSEFFYTGRKILIGYRGSSEEVVYVQSVNHNTKTITIVWTLRETHAVWEMIGWEIFAGVTLKNPVEEIGKSDTRSYTVDVADFSSMLDQKVIVDTYEDMYAREIVGRIVYDFTSDDSRVDLNECEVLTGITTSGVAITPTLSTEAIYKLKSINLGASGAWVATYRFPIAGSPVNISTYNRIRAWIKMMDLPANFISSITCRIIDGTGKKFEWNDGIISGPGWSYDSFDFTRSKWIGGTPSKTTATYFEIEIVALQAITLWDIKIDRISATSGGFTIRWVTKGNILFKDVRAQYKKPSTFIESLAKNNGFFWYVSTERDVQFFASEDRLAPMTVTDTSTNFNKLKITADITNLKNRQTVRGGQAPDSNLYDQFHVCDGEETSYRLDYPPKWLNVYVDTGGWFVLKTLGVENLVPDSSVDFVFNFSEKTVRNGSIATLNAGDVIKLEYYPYKDIRVQIRNQASIDLMKSLLWGDGIFDGAVISDASIKTFDEWRSRARAEINAYSNPILSATFETEMDGLEAGQIIHVTYPLFSIDSDFVIQKVDARQRTIDWPLLYSLSCGSSMYGLTEFFQYLLKRDGTWSIDVAEIVDVVQTIDETLIFSDAYIFKKKSPPFYVHSRNLPYDINLNFTEGGTANDAYVGFSQVA